MRWRDTTRLAVYAALVLLCVAVLLDMAWPPTPPKPYSTEVRAADGSLLHVYLTPDDKWRLYTALDEITPTVAQALVHKEDRYFYYHNGVNPLAVLRALVNNSLRGRRTSGASTLSMQVVRLLERRQRSYGNKLIEMLRAMQLELHYSKREILQLYLNLAPYGSNVEGIKAAAHLYFGRGPDALSLAQATTLSIIPNRPTSWRPGASADALVRARNQWLQRFAAGRVFDAATLQTAQTEPLGLRRQLMPRLAPHLSRRLAAAYPGQVRIQSSLVPAVQQLAQQQLHDYVLRLQRVGISNAAVVVVDNATMRVVGYVGAADFYDEASQGQVDGAMAVRSPGSALKPLLYATAFDQGVVNPRSVLLDVPTHISGYAPENYDEDYRGQVSMRQALALSLNIPAVRVLEQMGLDVLLGQLKQAGFAEVARQSKQMGLSTVLGGCGVRLDEMVALYAAFANQGSWQRLRWLQQDTVRRDSTLLISPAASYMLAEVLTQLTRPDLPHMFAQARNLPRVAWKTGTSYGRRDAWAIGYNKQYTVGVWVGNFDGRGNPNLSGADVATPLLFAIFNSIGYNTQATWFAKPSGLHTRGVCSESGLPPDTFCTAVVQDIFVPGSSPSQRCTHKKWVWHSADGRVGYCSACLPAAGAVKKLLPDIAPELAAFYASRRMPYAALPPHNPACTRVATSRLRITTPSDGAHYYLDAAGKRKLALSCQAEVDAGRVAWFVNDKFLQHALPGEVVFVRPDTGRLRVICSDDRGTAQQVLVHVH